MCLKALHGRRHVNVRNCCHSVCTAGDIRGDNVHTPMGWSPKNRPTYLVQVHL